MTATLRAVDPDQGAAELQTDQHRRHAVEALQRRLDRLERERQAIVAGVRGCEQAARWLSAAERDHATRRLRHVTRPVALQGDVFADLHHALYDDAA